MPGGTFDPNNSSGGSSGSGSLHISQMSGPPPGKYSLFDTCTSIVLLILWQDGMDLHLVSVFLLGSIIICALYCAPLSRPFPLCHLDFQHMLTDKTLQATQNSTPTCRNGWQSKMDLYLAWLLHHQFTEVDISFRQPCRLSRANSMVPAVPLPKQAHLAHHLVCPPAPQLDVRIRTHHPLLEHWWTSRTLVWSYHRPLMHW